MGVISKRTGLRKTYGHGRLRSIADRMTEHQQDRRLDKIAARRTVAERLGERLTLAGIVLGAHQTLLHRGFIGRLKWLLLGR